MVKLWRRWTKRVISGNSRTAPPAPRLPQPLAALPADPSRGVSRQAFPAGRVEETEAGALAACLSTYTEMTMPTKLKIAAIAAALAAGILSACQSEPAPSGPVSGAAAGGAAGAATGNAAAGPVGGIVGGAVGTATGAVTGTANAATGVVTGTANALTGGAAATPTCGAGLVYYNGGCHPPR